ncbi:hypothetical protein SBA2_450066 [Acidobacteriia bacterium SbA2]|nr:hypothetical protein SBA2_450066 [Acidobacteriia bacterium SbA2]
MMKFMLLETELQQPNYGSQSNSVS